MSTAVDSRQVSAKYYDEAYATKEDIEDLAFSNREYPVVIMPFRPL
jgi:hypothetical protein